MLYFQLVFFLHLVIHRFILQPHNVNRDSFYNIMLHVGIDCALICIVIYYINGRTILMFIKIILTVEL